VRQCVDSDEAFWVSVTDICNRDKYVRLVVRQCRDSDEAF